jgi:hypothetical protein
MITQRYLERDGSRLLLRIVVNDSAAFDILTNPESLAEARAFLSAAASRGLEVYRLGTFANLDVTIGTTDPRTVAVVVDGPDLGAAFRGNQAIVFYVELNEFLEALRDDA